jgi:hypothetical protein
MKTGTFMPDTRHGADRLTVSADAAAQAGGILGSGIASKATRDGYLGIRAALKSGDVLERFAADGPEPMLSTLAEFDRICVRRSPNARK